MDRPTTTTNASIDWSRLLESAGTIDRALAAKQAAEYEADIKKYEARSKETRAKADALVRTYDQLNLRDDQFDLSDAFLATAIAVAAVVSRLEPASGGAVAAFELSRARPRHACIPTIDIL